MSDHAQRIEQAFTHQAAAFEDDARNQVFTADARWAFDALPRSGDELVLDVAAGTGHAARQLAPSVRAVIALDATAAMLEQGRQAAAEAGLRNVVFARGDAARLPFLDGSFDITVCRFAVHHFEHPEVVIGELRRCTRPGGRVAVVDLVADPDPAVAAEQDRLQRLRDPSHTTMLSRAQLSALLAESGLRVDDVSERALVRPLEPWIEQTAPGDGAAEEIRARLHDELSGAAVTGFGPRAAAGTDELLFTQTFAACVAVR
jgi:ubiquinone/menaquinone biosynthesis C-methylase UbiE